MLVTGVCKKLFLSGEREWLFRNVHGCTSVCLDGLVGCSRWDAGHAEIAVVLVFPIRMDLDNVLAEGALCLVALLATFASLIVDISARERFHFQVLSLDVSFERLLLPELFVTWRISRAVEFGFVNILMPLQTPTGGEALPTSFPNADKSSLKLGIWVGILQVPLEMILAGKVFGATIAWTGKRAFFCVSAQVRFQATWTIKALSTALKIADVVPLSSSLTFRPLRAIVCEFHYCIVANSWFIGHEAFVEHVVCLFVLLLNACKEKISQKSGAYSMCIITPT
jgi:hypothetical protein